MKVLIVLASLVLAISAAADTELWLEFKNTYGRDYKSMREERTRFSIFQQNLRKIEEHNEQYEKGETSYYLGITKFADVSQEEYLSMLNYSQAAKPTLGDGPPHVMSGLELESEVNWVKRGAVAEVKNQGNCGSCWAFSTAGVLEGQYAVKKGRTVSLSEQNLMDCSTSYGNNGCEGGNMQTGYTYVYYNGIELESDYPYTAASGTCRFSKSLSVLSISGWTVIPHGDEYILKDAIANAGPIAAGVNAENYGLYAGGIYDKSCSDSLNHGIVIVGYGTENGRDYWLVKNSWGPQWGENGYIRMARNSNNLCGIATDASFPNVV